MKKKSGKTRARRTICASNLCGHQVRGHGPLFEPLERRELMSGVTLIAHGRDGDSVAPGWLPAMASAIINRTSAETAVFWLRLSASGGSGPVVFEAFELLAGLPPTHPNANGETVILLDWADASGFAPQNYHNTAIIAEMVAPFLVSPIPSRGITRPLAESPIHLIGHSRGASVVSQIAEELGFMGIWVDHLTTLDPHPLNYFPVNLYAGDPEPVVFNNVTFADNYWRQDGTLGETSDVDGKPIPGAMDFELIESTLDGTIDPGHNLEHSDVHLFYYGTMNTSLSATSEGIVVPASWYPDHGVSRDSIGYHYSRIGGGNRFSGPAIAGLHPLFGASNVRPPLDLSQATWPSLIELGVNDVDRTYVAGEPIHPVPFYADVDTGGQIFFFLDKDTNPYNTDDILLGVQSYDATQQQVFFAQPEFTTAAAAPGAYHLYARITDVTGLTRFIYTSGTVEILAPPPAGAAAPLVTVKATDRSASETSGGTPRGRGSITVTRSGSVNEPLTVHYGFAGTASNDGSDYALLPGFVTIPAGAKSAVIHVNPVDDALAEPAETVVVSLAQSSSYRLGTTTQRSATVTITDNEPTITIKATDKSATEKDANLSALTARGLFTIARKGGSLATPLEVSYAVAGTAIGGGDYAALTGSVTIPAGMASVTIQVDPIDDLIAEPGETVIVTLEAGETYRLGKAAEQTATVTIADFELAPESLAGLLFDYKTTLGTPPFGVKGTTATIMFSDSSAEYLIIGGKGALTSRGDYTYEKLTSTTGRLIADDEIAGIQFETIYTFTKTGRATFNSTTASGSFQSGTITQVKPVTFEAPVSIGGTIANGKITRGEAPFASKGTFLMSFGQNGTLSVLGGTGVASGTGTFTYERFNSSVGLLSFIDDEDGDELWGVFRFLSPIKANYTWVRDDTAAQQHGTIALS